MHLTAWDKEPGVAEATFIAAGERDPGPSLR
jgi:hypothetical protein